MAKIIDKWNDLPLTVKVSTAYAICSILQKCLSFITLPIFTRLLTTEQFGQVTIFNSWQGILTIIITLNLAYGTLSTAMVKYDDDREGYISSVEGVFLLLAGVFLAVYIPLRDYWFKLFELPTYIMILMVMEIIAANALLMWTGKKRFEFRYKSVVAITLAMSLISPIIQLLLVVNIDEKGYGRIIGAAAVTIAVGGFFFVFNLVKGKRIYNKRYWKYAFGFNVPLLAYYLSQVIFNQSDRIMISHIIGTDKAAVYGVAYSLAMVLTFVLNAINNSYVPWYYNIIKSGEMKENRSVSLAIATMMAVLLLAVIWFTPEIISIMAGDKYVEAIYVVPPVAISVLALFYAQLFANVEFYYEEKYSLVWASVIAAVVNLGLNWICISRFGFIAAAYTTLISYILFVLCNCIAMKRTLKRKEVDDNGFNYKGLMLLFIVFVFVAYVGVVLYSMLVVRVIISVIVIVVIMIKRQLLIGVYKTIRGEKN